MHLNREIETTLSHRFVRKPKHRQYLVVRQQEELLLDFNVFASSNVEL
ncbi:hypothetical protein I6F35_38790 [Bradyrhizobium sp. BRP22]|nr:hypothetical protein [Bradyrhizobium sp. BRP22]MCA1458988.1 hypothetical protein [Bradyrhizobium sp. BRP22]